MRNGRFSPSCCRRAGGNARTSGALRRARGIKDADRLLQVILMHTATGLSLRQTAVRAREQHLADISDVALLKRLRSSEGWLRWLTARLTEMPEIELLQELSGRRRVRVVDATTVAEQGGAVRTGGCTTRCVCRI